MQDGKPTESFRGRRILILIPAYNEEQALGPLLEEVVRDLPGHTVLVVNDGSSDGTAHVARDAGAKVLTLPYNTGVGTAVQAGFQYGWKHGYEYALRLDADGQHPPGEARKLMEVMQSDPHDLVLGTRYGNGQRRVSSLFRHVSTRGLALFLSLICRSRVTDPTSGFWLVNRRLMYVFSQQYPSDYPEPEALAFLRRLGYSFIEVPVRFRPRVAGKSSIGKWDTVFHALRVLVALFVDRVRPIDERLASKNVLMP